MEALRQYILQIVAAGLLCGIVIHFVGEKGTAAALIRMITGVFMLLTLVSPLADIHLNDLSYYFDQVSLETDHAVGLGQSAALEELSAIIKTKTEAYILDKAETYGAKLTVKVELDGSSPPVPCGVQIGGSISPYGKKQLQTYISESLGIPLEAQTWTG